MPVRRFAECKEEAFSSLLALRPRTPSEELVRDVTALATGLKLLRRRQLRWWLADLHRLARTYPELEKILPSLVPGEDEIESWLGARAQSRNVHM